MHSIPPGSYLLRRREAHLVTSTARSINQHKPDVSMLVCHY